MLNFKMHIYSNSFICFLDDKNERGFTLCSKSNNDIGIYKKFKYIEFMPGWQNIS